MKRSLGSQYIYMVLLGFVVISLSACGSVTDPAALAGSSWQLSLSGAETASLGHEDVDLDLACATRVNREDDLDYFAFVLRDEQDLSASALTFEYVEIEGDTKAAYVWLEQRTKIYAASDADIQTEFETSQMRIQGRLSATLYREDAELQLELSQLDIPLGDCEALPYIPSNAPQAVW